MVKEEERETWPTQDLVFFYQHSFCHTPFPPKSNSQSPHVCLRIFYFSQNIIHIYIYIIFFFSTLEIIVVICINLISPFERKNGKFLSYYSSFFSSLFLFLFFVFFRNHVINLSPLNFLKIIFYINSKLCLNNNKNIYHIKVDKKKDL